MDYQRLFSHQAFHPAHLSGPCRRPLVSATRAAASLGLLLMMGATLAQAQDLPTEQPSSETRSSSRANPVPAPIQAEEREGLQSATAQNNSVRPEKLEHSDELLQQVQLPDGFSISVFAEDLTNPRIIEVSSQGHVYVTEREAGQVTLLRDQDNNGEADETQPVASGLGEDKQGVHGLALSPEEDYLYMVTDTQLYRAAVLEEGELDEPELVLDNLPEAGQHPNRTLEFGPDRLLYLSIGSATNAAAEPNPLYATLVRFDPDQPDLTVDSLEIYAEGLRNTIGFAWNPLDGQLYGWDHSSDGRGDDWPPEEINRLEEGGHYGWPFCGGNQEVDLHVSEDPPEMTKQEFCAETVAPLVTHQPHTAGMQWVYYNGGQFPAEYQNDAFVTLRGSWNRNPPVGYEIVRIRHDQTGAPVAVEPFASGWLQGPPDAPAQFGRLSGLAQAPDGALLVANDSHGVIYRISFNSGG